MQTEDLKSHYEIRVKNRRRVLALMSLEESLIKPEITGEKIQAAINTYNERIDQLKTANSDSINWKIEPYGLSYDELISEVEILIVQACNIHESDADELIQKSQVCESN